ncbi:MAG: hypothetical protein QOD41_265 [Cryptosporangiaceae bacterium]|nr:hypothetical protein [Cryptosporangiaceae bacterium]
MTTSTQAPQSAQPEPQKTDGLDLSPAKVLASALAAISTSVAASYLGTMGTWIGAGAGSVVATVSTALYHHSLKRTGAKLKNVVPLPAGLVTHRDDTPAPHPDGRAHAQNGDDAAANPNGGTGRPAAEAGTATNGGLWELLRSLRWGRLLTVAGIVFALSIGTIVIYEVVTHKPISAQLRGEDVKGTSLTPKRGNSTPTTAPGPSAAATPGAAPSEKTSPKDQAPSPAATAQPVQSAN